MLTNDQRFNVPVLYRQRFLAPMVSAVSLPASVSVRVLFKALQPFIDVIAMDHIHIYNTTWEGAEAYLIKW